MNRNESCSIGISRARDIEMTSALLTEIKREIFGPMNRNESLQLQLATIIQEGHTSKATAYETAGRVLLAMYGLDEGAGTEKTGAPTEN